MKKSLSFVLTSFFTAASLGLMSCSDNSSNESDTVQGTTTGGLDIGIASEALNEDSTSTDTDTLGTTVE